MLLLVPSITPVIQTHQFLHKFVSNKLVINRNAAHCFLALNPPRRSLFGGVVRDTGLILWLNNLRSGSLEHRVLDRFAGLFWRNGCALDCLEFFVHVTRAVDVGGLHAAEIVDVGAS